MAVEAPGRDFFHVLLPAACRLKERAPSAPCLDLLQRQSWQIMAPRLTTGGLVSTFHREGKNSAVKLPYIIPLANKGFLHLAGLMSKPWNLQLQICEAGLGFLWDFLVAPPPAWNHLARWWDHGAAWLDENLTDDRVTPTKGILVSWSSIYPTQHFSLFSHIYFAFRKEVYYDFCSEQLEPAWNTKSVTYLMMSVHTFLQASPRLSQSRRVQSQYSIAWA